MRHGNCQNAEKLYKCWLSGQESKSQCHVWPTMTNRTFGTKKEHHRLVALLVKQAVLIRRPIAAVGMALQVDPVALNTEAQTVRNYYV